MEEHELTVHNLRETREQIRTLLVAGNVLESQGGNHFPRSTLMRMLLDPGKRRLATTLFSSLLLLSGRGRMVRALLGAVGR